MSARASTNGELLEHARLRLAVLDALGACPGGEGSLLDLHDALRERGVDLLDDPRRIYAIAMTLMESGLLTRRKVLNQFNEPRFIFQITDRGRVERARLGRP